MPAFDNMPDMELYQPVQIDDALALAARLADRGWLVGGGQDTYGWIKDRNKRPEALIDLNGIESLRGVRETENGIEIGALTTLTEVA
ncbi:MAG: FAD binding domain-containing protein, partial [Pseudohongiella sp.]|nr:FAD binding domain-containing protein [Pseudohongiella sp.]